MQLRLLPVFITILLAACATYPEFDTRQADLSLTPININNKQTFPAGKKIIWGGVILETRNLKESTRIEVLAYPLDQHYMPQQDQTPLGRFMISQPGYLEATSYSQGRLVTVVGKLDKQITGKIGETEYNYPLIFAEKLHLWSKDGNGISTRFHFGIGIGL